MELSVSIYAHPIPSGYNYAAEGKKISVNYNFHAMEKLFSSEGSILGGGSLLLSLEEARDLVNEVSESISKVESDTMKSFS